MALFPSRLGTEVSNQVDEMEYSFDDSVEQDSDMPDAERLSVLDGASLYHGAGGPSCRSRWINIARSERHVGHAETSRNSKDPFATMIWLLVTLETEKDIHEVLEDQEGNGVLHHLRAVDKYLGLGENRSLLNHRRFPDGEGNDLMCKSAKHGDTLDLLCDIHDFQNSNEPVAAKVYVKD